MRHPEVLLAPALMVLDYYMTLVGASLAQRSYRRHVKIDHYELNPIWQNAVAERRWFNPRHLALVMLAGGLLVLLAEIVELDTRIFEALLGFVFTLFGLVLGRHLSNILMFVHLARNPDEIAGEAHLSHSFVLSSSIYQLLVAAVPIGMIALFSPSPFVFGAVAAVLALGLAKTLWLARALLRGGAKQSVLGSNS
jgi:hypothetical protein